MGPFGVQHTIVPNAPAVNTAIYNAIALVGIAPKGPRGVLTLCGSDTDDTQFGSCLAGFNIPRALSVIRGFGAGNVIVENEFDPAVHTAQVTNENVTVTAQRAALAFDPIEITGVAAISTQTVSTGATANDALAGIVVGSVALLGQPILFAGGSATATALEIINAINAYTATSGYSAAAGTAGQFIITGPVATGADINGVAPTFGTITGATLALSTAAAFAGGVNALVSLKNTPVSAVSAVAASATMTFGTATSPGSITGLLVGSTNIIPGGITAGSGTGTATASTIKDEINANTGTTGYSATSSAAVLTIVGPAALGATINGYLPALQGANGVTTTGATVFVNGVNAVTAVAATNYVRNTDYVIDEFGNIRFLIAITDGTVVRATYKKLDASTITDATIIGTVSDTTRTGLKNLANCKSVLGIAPKFLIVPGYNTSLAVQTEMLAVCDDMRMRTFFAPTAGMTKAQAITSRTPTGPLVTFKTASKRAKLAYPLLKTYDPKTATFTLDDPSAAMAGHWSFVAATLGPQESPSNRVMQALGGVEVELLHKWEDINTACDTNQLRAQGLTTFFTDAGIRWWGTRNASYPTNVAVDSNDTCIYVNDIISDNFTDFAKQVVDRNITDGTIKSLVGACNDYYSTLKASKWIGEDSVVIFEKSRNTDANLALGKLALTRKTFYYVQAELIEFVEIQNVQLPNVTPA